MTRTSALHGTEACPPRKLSEPGQQLLREWHELGVPVTPLPEPCRACEDPCDFVEGFGRGFLNKVDYPDFVRSVKPYGRMIVCSKLELSIDSSKPDFEIQVPAKATGPTKLPKSTAVCRTASPTSTRITCRVFPPYPLPRPLEPKVYCPNLKSCRPTVPPRHCPMVSFAPEEKTSTKILTNGS